MTSLERVNMVFAHKEPDRVPITEMSASEVVWRGCGAKSLYEFQQMMDYDMMYVRIAYRPSNLDEAYFTDEWGIQYKRVNNENIGHSVGHPIQTPNDLSKLILPDPDDPYRYSYLEQCVKDYKGKKSIAFSSRLFFLWATELCGMDNLLMLMAEEPEFCEDLFDQILENQTKIYKNAIRMGADVVIDTDDFAYNIGPFMSPGMFEDMIVPRLTKFCNDIHSIGGRVMKHTDGDVRKLLDMIVGCGIDAFQSVDPSAGMDIADVKQKYGDKITIVGNIDCSDLLSFGTPDQVRQTVIDTIRVAAPGGGYILSSSNTLTSATRLDCLQAMMDTAREFGVYPIR